MTARLVETAGGIGLVDDEQPELSPLVLDLRAPRVLTRHDDVLKALGRGSRGAHKVHTVVDATGGLGRDAGALAAAGFSVTVLERAPLLQALWQDALQRAGDVDNLRFVPADAVTWLREHPAVVDAVYLDPMYPHGPRKALQQREMRLLRAAVGDDDDSAGLLAAAWIAARHRVVVKRPRHAPPLHAPGIAAPHHAWQGASTRYDLYLVPARGVASDGA